MTTRTKRFMVWVFLVAVIVFAIQFGGQFLANRWLLKRFGPDAGTFQIHLWRLQAISEKGALAQKGSRLAWENMKISLVTQRLHADVAELTYKGKPIANARQLEVDHLFGAPALRLEKLEILPDAMAWKGIRSAWSSPGEEGGVIRPFSIWLPAVETRSPTFPVKGSGLCWSSGGEVFASGMLSSGEKGHLDFQGKIGKGSGEIFLAGELFQGKIEVVATGNNDTWSGMTDYQRAGVHWEGDFRAGGQVPIQFLLRNTTSRTSKEWLFVSWPYGDASAHHQPTIKMVEGGISLAALGFSEMPFKNRINIAVEEEINSQIINGKHPCISVVVFPVSGDIEKRMSAYPLANLNWRLGERDRFTVSATLPASIVSILPNILDGATLGGEIEGLSQPEMRFLGSLNSNTVHLQLHGEGSKGNYTAVFDAALPGSRLSGILWWFQEEWGGSLKGDFSLPRDLQIPLPSGSWWGEAKFEGKGDTLESAEVDASESYGGTLSCRYEANVLTIGYSGDLSASWGTVSAARCDANIEIQPSPFSILSTQAKIVARKAQAGELVLANLTAEAEGREVLDIRSQMEFPDLKGSLKSRWNLPLRSMAALTMEEGHLELEEGFVKIEHLQVRNLLQSSEHSATWNAKRVWVKGEPFDSLTGEVTSPTKEDLRIHGAGQGLGGKLLFEIALNSQGENLQVQFQQLDAPKAVAYLRRFESLPFSVLGGKLDGTMGGPLANFEPGWKVEIRPKGVTFQVPDERHQLREADGLLRLAVKKEGMVLSSEALTLEKGRIPLKLEGLLGEKESSLLFTIPPAPAPDVQNALFDFLPEFVGFGTFTGKLGLEGHFEIPEREPLLRVRVLMPDGGSFRSEDRAMVLEGMVGALSLSVPIGDWGATLRGYAAPVPGGRKAAQDRFTTELLPGDLLKVERIRYSVFSMSDAILSSSDGADAVTRIRLTQGSLWDGLARGEFALAVDRDDIRYSGQLLLDRASLKAFCVESEGATGYLGGRFSTSVTFGANRLGLGALKAVAELEADPLGGEPLLLGRDFLVKIGGNAMERLVKQEFQPYDKAFLKVGVRSGNLSVQSLILEHQADPFSALFKRDLSYELRMPASNSISLYHLLDLVKGLESATASVQTSGKP